jgi:hypothetical protein
VSRTTCIHDINIFFSIWLFLFQIDLTGPHCSKLQCASPSLPWSRPTPLHVLNSLTLVFLNGLHLIHQNWFSSFLCYFLWDLHNYYCWKVLYLYWIEHMKELNKCMHFKWIELIFKILMNIGCMLDLLLTLSSWLLQLDMYVPKLSMLYGSWFPFCEELGVMHGVFEM